MVKGTTDVPPPHTVDNFFSGEKAKMPSPAKRTTVVTGMKKNKNKTVVLLVAFCNVSRKPRDKHCHWLPGSEVNVVSFPLACAGAS